MMTRQQSVLSEIKTTLRILNTFGNTLVPSLDGKDTTAHQRMCHFIDIAKTEFGMTLEEIEEAIA
jgi:hypothetical protein